MRTTLRTAGILVGLLVALWASRRRNPHGVCGGELEGRARRKRQGIPGGYGRQRLSFPMQRAPLSRSRSSQGRPPILFISADLDWMDYLERPRLVKVDTRRNLLRNRLVLIAPADSRISVKIEPGFPLARVLGDGRLAMANPDAVPAGKYGKALWRLWGRKGRCAEGGWSRERASALVWSPRGSAAWNRDRTDAAVEPKVRIVAEFPENSHPAIIYLPRSRQRARAPRGVPGVVEQARCLARVRKYGFQISGPRPI